MFPIIAALLGLAGTVYAAKKASDNYSQQLAYNTPAAQMQRFKDAGLSPYLIYSQGNNGNAAQPAPVVVPDINDAIGRYQAAANFKEDLKSRRLQNAMLANEVKQTSLKNKIQSLQFDSMYTKNNRSALDLLSDYPQFGFTKFQQAGENYDSSMLIDSFRQKMNESKLALSQAELSKKAAATIGQHHMNDILGKKAEYARDYGMVGGDWTQGLGLLKSVPSLFRTSHKVPAAEKALIDSYRKFQMDKHKRDANRFLFENLIH